MDFQERARLLIYTLRSEVGAGALLTDETPAAAAGSRTPIGRRKIAFHYNSDLHIANALPYPHPVRDTAAFTYVLSQSAEIEIEIYSLTGRLIHRLGPLAQEPGFRQVDWNGRDGAGKALANGTYLYRIIARGAGRDAVFRGPLTVAR